MVHPTIRYECEKNSDYHLNVDEQTGEAAPAAGKYANDSSSGEQHLYYPPCRSPNYSKDFFIVLAKAVVDYAIIFALLLFFDQISFVYDNQVDAHQRD